MNKVDKAFETTVTVVAWIFTIAFILAVVVSIRDLL